MESGEDGGVSMVGLLAGIGAFCLLATCGGVICVRRAFGAKKTAEAEEKQVPVAVETETGLPPTVVVAPVKGKPADEEHGVPDDTSTITPKDDDFEKISEQGSSVPSEQV